MSDILLITCTETNKRTGKKETIVSHGIDMDSGKTIILPCDPIEVFVRTCGARFDQDMGEWIMKEPARATA